MRVGLPDATLAQSKNGLGLRPLSRRDRRLCVLMSLAVALSMTRYAVLAISGLPLIVIALASVCVMAILGSAPLHIGPCTYVLVLCAVLSATQALSPQRAFQWLILLIVTLASVSLMSPRLLKAVIVWGSLAGGLANASLIVLEWLNLKPGALDFDPLLVHEGLSEYYLQSAYYSAIACGVSLWLSYQSKTTARRAALVVAAAVSFSAVLIANSRGAVLFLAVFGATVLTMLTNYRKSSSQRTRRLLPLAAAVVMVCGIWLGWFSDLEQRLGESTASSLSFSDSRRVAIQRYALSIAADHPLGIGWNGFSTLTSSHFGASIRSAHSLFLGLALDLGVFGGAIFISLLVVPLTLLVIEKERRTDPFSVLFIGIILGVLINGLVDTIQVAPAGMVMHIVLMPIGWSYVTRRRRSPV
ncbi:unannotated protein [freshwater metagenome]|uniref:Unannotated protein n=1 Tax=freshwater metagenome TaxID=449393 RepID=A0A6J6WW94_9ZZZZ